MNLNRNVIIRADASPSKGTWRITRCLALAHSLSKLGYHSSFVCGPLPSTLRRKIRNDGYGLFSINAMTNAAFETRDVNEIILAEAPSWFILDGNKFDDSYQHRLETGGTRLVCLGDNNSQSMPSIADVILNGRRENVHFDSNNVHLTQFIDGPDYTLLPHNNAENLPESKRVPVHVKKLVILFEGQHSEDMTRKTLVALDQCSFQKIAVDVVFDSANASLQRLETVGSECEYSIRFHRNKDRIQSLVAKTDLAIMSVGTGFYEFASYGVPAIVVPNSPYEFDLASRLERFGAAVNGGLNSESAKLTKLIRSIARNQDCRFNLSESGRRLVNGSGADRIARLISSKEYSFRSATLKDCDRLCDWRNDPEMRAVGFDQSIVSRESHFRWMIQCIDSEQIDYVVIEDRQGRAIGDYRLEYETDFRSARLNISLVPSMRGRGMGTSFIERACFDATRLRPDLEVVAFIKSNDPMSQNAFRKAGFEAIEPSCINGQVAVKYSFKKKLAELMSVSASRNRRMAS